VSTPESRIKTKVTKYLRAERIWYFFPAANGFGRAGIPDIIAIVRGQFIGIECKADCTKKPTKLQQQCGQQIKQAGGEWFLVCDDKTLEEVKHYVSGRESESISSQT